MSKNRQRVTTQELADRLGVDYLVANTLLRLLESQGKAKHVDTVRTAARGRGKKVYEVPSRVTLRLLDEAA